MGAEGCTAIVAPTTPRSATACRSSGSGTPAAPGWPRASRPARGRRGVRGDDPGVRQGAADLGGARAGGRRRGLRPGADRHGHPGPSRPGLRHRSRRRPQRDRRGRRHGAPRRPEPHGRRSGVVHVVTDDRRRGLRPGPAAGRAARRGRARWTRRRPTDADLAALLPESPKRAYDVHPLVSGLLDEPGRGAAPALGAEHRHHARPPGRAHRRRDRQQPAAARRLPGLHVGGEGGQVRADVRRVRRAAGRARGRARLPARRRPGVGRRGAPRREAAARVRRGGRAAGDAGDPQGLRRRVHRDELARPSARPGCSPGRARRSP